MKKYFVLPVAVLLGALSLSSCSESDDDNDNTTNTFDIVKTSPIVDDDSNPANTLEANYKVNTFGNTAMDACEELGKELGKANAVIGKAKLSDVQSDYLYKVLENVVSNVIVPTYTQLADETEALEKTLHGLTTATITQQQINSACADCNDARKY